MMKVSAFLIVVLLGITSVAARSGGAICGILEDNLPDTIQCDSCAVSFRGRFGFNAKLGCALKDPYCVPIIEGNELCATLSYNGEYYRRGRSSVTTVEGKFAQLDIAVPPLPGTFTIPETSVKIELTHASPITLDAPVNFDSCKITYGSEECICEICKEGDVGTGVKVDCTNIVLLSLSNATTVNIPPFNNGECLSIGI